MCGQREEQDEALLLSSSEEQKQQRDERFRAAAAAETSGSRCGAPFSGEVLGGGDGFRRLATSGAVDSELLRQNVHGRRRLLLPGAAQEREREGDREREGGNRRNKDGEGQHILWARWPKLLVDEVGTRIEHGNAGNRGDPREDELGRLGAGMLVPAGSRRSRRGRETRWSGAGFRR